MKTLFLLRHAKSSWDNANQADFERPLNKRGREAAPLIGRFIRQNEVKPDVIISSTATRARETTELVIDASKLKPELRFDKRIYDATWLDLLKVIAGIEDEKESALLVGHNPGFEETVFRLTDEKVTMPTAALVKIKLDIEHWNETTEFCGKFDWIMKPKEL